MIYLYTFDGIKLYQPECRCAGTGHLCYLRPVGQKVYIAPSQVIGSSAQLGIAH